MKKTFLSYFCTMKDHRINRKKLHPLINIVAIAIVGVICGMATWEEISLFGKLKKDFFSKFLDLKNGIPSKDTFRRFFIALDPQVFELHFTEWAKALAEKINKKIDNEVNHDKEVDKESINIDGKTIRQASRMQEDNPIHLVSAWAGANELILGQVKTEEKSNEITAIPLLLEALFLEDSIVTIDAMGCQKNIVEKKVEKKADYVLALKGNHPTLLEDVTRSFDKKNCDDFYQTINSDHGRIEERKCSIITDLNFIFDREAWKNLKSIVRIESQRTIKKTGEIQQETRYYISSLNHAKQILNANRSHWGVENSLHWCLDMVFGEDRSSKRKGFSAQNFSLINKIALNLFRKNKTNDIQRFKNQVGINTKRKFAACDDSYLFELIKLI